MLEQFKGKSEEEIKTSIDQLSQSDLQNLIEESKNRYDLINQQKAQVEAEIKVTQENLNTEMNSLKELGINSVEELETLIQTEKNKLNTDLTNLVNILNGVQ